MSGTPASHDQRAVDQPHRQDPRPSTISRGRQPGLPSLHQHRSKQRHRPPLIDATGKINAAKRSTTTACLRCARQRAGGGARRFFHCRCSPKPRVGSVWQAPRKDVTNSTQQPRRPTRFFPHKAVHVACSVDVRPIAARIKGLLVPQSAKPRSHRDHTAMKITTARSQEAKRNLLQL